MKCAKPVACGDGRDRHATSGTGARFEGSEVEAEAGAGWEAEAITWWSSPAIWEAEPLGLAVAHAIK